MVLLVVLDAFLSIGGSMSLDADGFRLGAEVSAGYTEFAGFFGAAFGAELDPTSLGDTPRGRVYLEAEGGFAGLGMGGGPAFVFGNDTPGLTGQVTAFFSVSNILSGECSEGPWFLVASPFYRYTERRGGGHGTHAGGLFVKGLRVEGLDQPAFEDSCNT